MRRSSLRPLRAAALVASTALLATGCAGVPFAFAGGQEPERDGATGEVVESVEADPFALRVGDCLDSLQGITGEYEEVESILTVPCGQAHDSEVYASHLIADEKYPGDDGVIQQADDFCYAEFAGFVGMAYEDSGLDLSTLFPSSDSWKYMDDREILCLVVDPAGGVTGTLAGAAY